jgi:hypothetical protein
MPINFPQLLKKVSLSSPAMAFSTNALSKQSRTPLIKFLGKRSLLKTTPTNPSHQGPPGIVTTPQQLPSPSLQHKKVAKVGTGVDFTTLDGGAWYGRPRLTKQEMDAIDSGGAF